MKAKKSEYEEEIGKILRKVMEVSFLRKKNREKLGAIMRQIEGAREPEKVTFDMLLKEYTEIREKVVCNTSSAKSGA